MSSTDTLKAVRLRRERLMRYTNPHVRPFNLQRDAWVLWAAYDLGSFPDMPKGLQQEEFFGYVQRFTAVKAACLIVEEDHKYFREKRGPVAIICVDRYAGGWRIEPQIDFFFWAGKRQRLAAAVSFLQMVRYSKDVGVCVVRVEQKDTAFCEHLCGYDVLRPTGKLPNARPTGDEFLYHRTGRKDAPAAVVAKDDERRAA